MRCTLRLEEPCDAHATPTGSLALVERIAGAVRGELGEEIDPYPGLRDPDQRRPAQPRLPRRRPFAPGGGRRAPRPTWPRPRPARSSGPPPSGWRPTNRDAVAIKMLIEDEPGHPDDWLCFLILADLAQIEPLLDPDPR